MTTPDRPAWGHGRLYVLAHRDEIAADVAAGHTIRSLHAKHVSGPQGLRIGYAAFRRLVARYVGVVKPTAVGKDAAHGRKETEHTGRVDPSVIRRLTRG